MPDSDGLGRWLVPVHLLYQQKHSFFAQRQPQISNSSDVGQSQIAWEKVGGQLVIHQVLSTSICELHLVGGLKGGGRVRDVLDHVQKHLFILDDQIITVRQPAQLNSLRKTYSIPTGAEDAF